MQNAGYYINTYLYPRKSRSCCLPEIFGEKQDIRLESIELENATKIRTRNVNSQYSISEKAKSFWDNVTKFLAEKAKSFWDNVTKFLAEKGISIDEAEDCVVEGIKKNKFWIFSHPHVPETVMRQAKLMLENKDLLDF